MTDQTASVWLVTGCSSGLGLALATKLARETGHRAVITGLKAAEVEHIAQVAPDRIKATELDITDRNSVAAVIEFTVKAFGRLDVLVNNAGVGQIGAIEELDDGEIARVMNVNLFGTLNMLRAAVPQMRQQRSGRILTLTSMGGFRGRPGVGIYNASKFALEGVHEALAGEVGPLGIDVTMVEPGLFKSSFRGGGMHIAKTIIEDYAGTAGKVRASVAEDYPASAADPTQIAAAILAVGEMAGKPPLRLQLGTDAVAATREKLESMTREVAKWEAVANLASEGGEGSLDTYRSAIAAVTG
ncbi:SDR family NAD(P)-dependent oxidoreductase [Mesorhizobium sp. ANAO-SY3R2]|uniref:SDR family NAD(P)-dependent oxidoreductase n=1 Tax=Mesorhizobium sp. ANAO-SY3R2 TaxID=3166644 RepID=UPI00366C7A54